VTEASRPVARRISKAPPTSERAIFARASSIGESGPRKWAPIFPTKSVAESSLKRKEKNYFYDVCRKVLIKS